MEEPFDEVTAVVHNPVTVYQQNEVARIEFVHEANYHPKSKSNITEECCGDSFISKYFYDELLALNNNRLLPSTSSFGEESYDKEKVVKEIKIKLFTSTELESETTLKIFGQKIRLIVSPS